MKYMRFKTILLVLLLVVLAACNSDSSSGTPSLNQVTNEANSQQSSVNSGPSNPDAAEKTPLEIDLSPTAITSVSPTLPIPLPGLHIHNFNSAKQVSLGDESGAGWTRYDGFNWDAIEPERKEPPEYLWSNVDEVALLNAAEGGYEIFGIILFTPYWAQKYPGIACGPIAEKEFDRFAQFMNALVNRYSKPPYNVKYWEIGNEPDVDYKLVPPDSGFGCWGEDADPYFGGGYYGEMLKIVYPAIKSADPEAQVVVGGLLLNCDPVNTPEGMDCKSSTFIEGILNVGGGDYFDGISFHAYDYFFGDGAYGNVNWNSSSDTTGPVVTVKANYLKGLLVEYGYTSKYLFNTEVAVLCGSSGKEPFCLEDNYNQTKSNYVASSNVAASAAGLNANIWYSLTGWRASGLVEGAELTPLPAYDAYRFNADLLKDAQYIRKLEDYEGVAGYEFERDGETLWVLWSLDAGDHRITLSENPSAVYDVYGTPLAFGNSLLVTLSPVYVIWSR